MMDQSTHKIIICMSNSNANIVIRTYTPKEIEEQISKAIHDNNRPGWFKNPPTNIIFGSFPETRIIIPVKNILFFTIEEIK